MTEPWMDDGNAALLVDRLPPGIRALHPADPPYRVRVSERLERWQRALIDELEATRPAGRT